MATVMDNEYTMYEFNDEELISAATFSQLQKMYIQTKMAQYAVDKVQMQLAFDKTNEFIRATAFADGAIAFAKFLLDHENAEDAAIRWAELIAATKKVVD